MRALNATAPANQRFKHALEKAKDCMSSQPASQPDFFESSADRRLNLQAPDKQARTQTGPNMMQNLEAQLLVCALEGILPRTRRRRMAGKLASWR